MDGGQRLDTTALIDELLATMEDAVVFGNRRQPLPPGSDDFQTAAAALRVNDD